MNHDGIRIEEISVQVKPKASRLQRLGDDEAEDCAETPWLIEGLLPDGGLTVVYGEPGTGKSFVVLDWNLHIAMGADWLGRQVRQGPTLYFVGEGQTAFKRRIIAAKQNRWQKVSPFGWYREPIDLSSAKDADRFLGEIKDIQPAAIVLDTLTHYRGGAEENSATEMGPVLRVFDKAREIAGCAVLCVHHPTKSDKEVIRGTGALLGAADCSIHVKGSGGSVTLTCKKMKDADQFKPIKLSLVKVSWAHAVTGAPLDSCQVGPRTGEDPEAEEENAAGLRKVENFMRAAAGERFSLRAIRAGAGVRHGTERGLVDSLVERGLVRREGDKWYFDPNCAGRSR